MKKVTSITLGGIVFAVEEDAYETLAAYLRDVEHSFRGNDDYAEIASDIESAIADKFLKRRKNDRNAVTLADVEEVISQMGHVEDLTDEEAQDAGAEQPAEGEESKGESEPKKRLYRDTDDVIIAGVASGIARYFGIDPVIVRLLFVASIFITGLGVLAYIILWLIVPAAETTTQKYSMRGEGMTIADISERVKKNLNNLDERDVARAKGAWAGVRAFLHNIFLLLGRFIRVLMRIARYALGLVLVTVGALGIAGIISAGSVVWFVDGIRIATDSLVSSTAGFVFVIALLTIAFIPLLILVLAGSSLLLGRNLFTLAKTLTLGIVWIVAVSFTGSFAMVHGTLIVERLQNMEDHFDDRPFQLYGTWNDSEGGVWIDAQDDSNATGTIVHAFRNTLEAKVYDELGQPIEGYEPKMFLMVFPGLEESDFNGVEAMIGHYEYEDGRLVHELDGARVVHSAAGAIAPHGYETLLDNVANRLEIDLDDGALQAVVEAIEREY